MNVFDLFATLSLDSSNYDEGLSNAESSGQSFGTKLKSGLGTAAKVGGVALAAVGTAAAGATKSFISGVANVASYGDAIDKNSQKMNMSATAYQEWDFVMQHAGTSIDSMKMSIKTLSNAAETGKDSFERLGISQEQIASMSGEELFGATISALQNVEDETERTYLAGQLLGRGATELGPLLNMSAEELEGMKQQAHELGGVLSDDTIKNAAQFEDSLQNMQTAFNGTKNSMLSDFLPAFSTTMDGLASIFSGSDIEGGLGKVEEGVKNLADGLVKKAPEVFAIGGKILNALLTSLTTNLPILLDAGLPVIMELANSLISAAPSIISGVLQVIGSIGQALGDPANLENLIGSAVAIITTISDSISQNAETVIPAIVEIIMQMMTALTDESTLMPLLSAGLSVITSVVKGILKAIPVLIKNLPTIISNITSFLVNSTPLIISAAIELFGGIISAIPEIISELIRQLPTIIATIVKSLGDGVGAIAKVGENLIKGLWNGISNMSKWIGDKIKGFGEGILNGLKNFFGIHSPSTLFEKELGENLAKGLGVGFDKALPDTMDDMAKAAQAETNNLMKSLEDPFSDLSIEPATISASNSGINATYGQASSQNITAEITRAIKEALNSLTLENNVYIGTRKIEQQITTAISHSNMISGGR